METTYDQSIAGCPVSLIERETVNGYEIIQQSVTPGGNGTRPGRVILVDRGPVHEPYVTAWQGGHCGKHPNGDRWDTSWCHGHYFTRMSDAIEDFNRRVKRGY